MDTYKKISLTEIEVTKQAPIPAPNVVRYERGFIEQQILDITEQRDKIIVLKQVELDECNAILSEMNKLNITTKNIVNPLPVI